MAQPRHARRSGTVMYLLVVLGLVACGGASERPPAAEATTSPAPSHSSPVASHGSGGGRKGIDVSHYQGTVDWVAVRAAGISFAFAKATEASSDVDPEFARNWSAMKAAGVTRGAYHFFHPDEDPALQAEHFIATVTLEPGDLPPALDIEVAEGATTASITADIEIWLKRVTEAFGVRPVLYSDASFINKHLASGFSQYPLWLAEYEAESPSAPGDWAIWTFWQHSQTGQVDGVEGDVDLDLFQGTPQAWAGLLLP